MITTQVEGFIIIIPRSMINVWTKKRKRISYLGENVVCIEALAIRCKVRRLVDMQVITLKCISAIAQSLRMVEQSPLHHWIAENS